MMIRMACEARYMQIKWGIDPLVFLIARELVGKVLLIFEKLHIDFTNEKTYNHQVASVFRAIKEETISKEMKKMISDAGVIFLRLDRFCSPQSTNIEAMLDVYKDEFNLEKNTFPSYNQARNFLIDCGYGNFI